MKEKLRNRIENIAAKGDNAPPVQMRLNTTTCWLKQRIHEIAYLERVNPFPHTDTF